MIIKTLELVLLKKFLILKKSSCTFWKGWCNSSNRSKYAWNACGPASRDGAIGADEQQVERDDLMPFRGTLSVDKARDLLGYNAQYPIEHGFTEYVQWYKDFVRHHDFIQQARSYRQQHFANANGVGHRAD